MAKSELRVAPKKGMMRTILEMIGRVAPVSVIMGKSTWDLYSSSPSIDYSKVNYHLARAIFYASIVRDPVSQKDYGEKYLLGAGFGKPIVNIAAAFTIGKLPEIKINGKTDDDVTEWAKKQKSKLFKTLRNSMRDGDAYARLDKQNNVELLPAEQMDEVIDGLTGEILGYDRTQYVKDPKDQTKTQKYVTKYRKTGVYKQVYKYDTEKAKEGVLQKEMTVTDNPAGEGNLDIVHFANEREDNQLYGNSEYQNCYYYMLNYHAVLENAVKNNIFNSTSTPYFTGVEDIQTFLAANGVKGDDGKYKINWDGKQLMIGGKSFKIDFAASIGTEEGALKLLNVFFWLISQTSETPEFAFGTAVQSSKASVSEQMPVLVAKAERKQGEYTDPLIQLITVYLNKTSKGKEDGKDLNVSLVWQPIVDKDMKLTLDIVKFLAEQGVITDETTLLMLGAGDSIPNLKAEIKKARAESKEKQSIIDGGSLGQADDEEAMSNLSDEEKKSFKTIKDKLKSFQKPKS